MRNKRDIKECLGEGVCEFLYATIKNGKIRREILKNLASELDLMMIYEAYINRFPFDGAVANEMFFSILDEVSVNRRYYV